MAANLGSMDHFRWQALSHMFDDAVLSMWPRGAHKSWWTVLGSSVSHMTYECDAKLGSPKTMDCTQLQKQISSSTDNLQLHPEKTKFLASSEHEGCAADTFHGLIGAIGTCHVAISTTVSIVLTWKQIQTALDALSGICVSHPRQPTQGGRAFYRKSPTSKGRRWTKREKENINGTLYGPNPCYLWLLLLTTPPYRVECFTTTCQHHYL